MMNLQEILSGAEAAVAAATDERSLDEVRVKYLGKKGELTALLKTLGSLEPDERPKVGAATNSAHVAATVAMALIGLNIN